MADETTITWVRPNGSEITTGKTDENIALAAKAGWKPKSEKKPVKKAD